MSTLPRHNKNLSMRAAYCGITSPVGNLTLIAHDTALLAVLWPQEQPRHLQLDLYADATHAILQRAALQLSQYFAGQLQEFDLPIAWVSGTAFQQSVWQALRHIPYGQTCSYKSIAEQLGNANAVRAVGAANGQNPLSIIVPCHRVIGANQKLVGYAGGLTQKQWLLEHEKSAVKNH